jgi:MarR family 2-MHQ and catechol resistance regulon transcriptional repressor
MRIEQEIKQKAPFRSEKHRAHVNIVFTHNWITERSNRYVKAFDITLQQYNVLRILRGANGPLSTSAIRERMLDRMSDSSRIVDRLCQKGLVERSVSARDRRLVDVAILPKGLELLVEMDRKLADFDDVMNALSEEEAAQLNNLLDKIRG